MSSKPAVCVTGANGFIGTHLIQTLISHNYTAIHASVHPSSDATHLLSLPGVTVHSADLLDPASLFAAISGCKDGGVFHVASPCTLEDPLDPERELVKPAVEGTLNVLEAARKAGVRRVVVVSSISAMVPNPKWEGKVFDETSWTDLDYCRSRQKWYPVSKTLAEKAAWEFAEKHKMDIVTIHPATCLGPLLQPGLNASSAVLQQLLQGSNDAHEYHWLGAVNVKDVAEAQVLLFEQLMLLVDTCVPMAYISLVILLKKSLNSFPSSPSISQESIEFSRKAVLPNAIQKSNAKSKSCAQKLLRNFLWICWRNPTGIGFM